MNIKSSTKDTTTDATEPVRDSLNRPLRDLRISVTDRCNFRCPYCMPAEVYGDKYRFLPRSEILSFEEIHRLTSIVAALGATKLRITGGEPLVRANLPRLVHMLAEIPNVADVALTTNGFLLEPMAEELKKAGLNRVTISLDALDDATYMAMGGTKHGPQRTLAAIAAAQQLGLGPIKVNAVIQRGINEHAITELADYFKDTGVIVRFIEFMDVGTLNQWDYSKVVAAREILAILSKSFVLQPLSPNYRGEVASRYGYRDATGELGIISSVTQPFCGNCTRARLTTNGNLVTCLFAISGIDLKAPLRSGATDQELRALIGGVWRARQDQYSQLRATLPASGQSKIEMYQLGG